MVAYVWKSPILHPLHNQCSMHRQITDERPHPKFVCVSLWLNGQSCVVVDYPQKQNVKTLVTSD